MTLISQKQDRVYQLAIHSRSPKEQRKPSNQGENSNNSSSELSRLQKCRKKYEAFTPSTRFPSSMAPHFLASPYRIDGRLPPSSLSRRIEREREHQRGPDSYVSATSGRYFDLRAALHALGAVRWRWPFVAVRGATNHITFISQEIIFSSEISLNI